MNKGSIRILSLIVTGYLLLALIWWTILLSREALHNFKLEQQLYRVDHTALPYSSPAEVESNYKRKSLMIIGESVVLGLSLLVGVYLIQRAHYKELRISQQQNNFLLAITHELKTPLTAIKMGIETLLKRDLDKSLQKELLQDSLTEGDRLENLINNLLLTNRLSTGVDLNKQELDASEHANQFFNKSRYNEQEVSVHIDTNAKVSIDPSALDLVYSNVIENALKYRKQDPVAFNISNNEDHVVVQVVDDGPGIPAKHRKEVFEKFFRVGNEDTRRTKGTGLGLYITKQIVHGHKGSINIKDNKPTGCIIQITIPTKN